MRDFCNQYNPSLVVAASTVTATGDLSAVDLQGGAEVAAFLIHIGTVAAADDSNYHTITAKESANGTDYTAITDPLRYVTPKNRLLASAPHGNGPFVINNTNLANTTHLFGVTYGSSRYMKLSITETGTASAVLTIFFFKAAMRTLPALQSATV